MNIFGISLEDATAHMGDVIYGLAPGDKIEVDELMLNSLHAILDVAENKVEERKIQIGGF
ncbi:MAG: hypothetical protein K5643_05390 [Saccharofermentans sp.]|jgi:hypothetical protein|nr:hypothetical protein [Saccharofermentans sp.]